MKTDDYNWQDDSSSDSGAEYQHDSLSYVDAWGEKILQMYQYEQRWLKDKTRKNYKVLSRNLISFISQGYDPSTLNYPTRETLEKMGMTHGIVRMQIEKYLSGSMQQIVDSLREYRFLVVGDPSYRYFGDETPDFGRAYYNILALDHDLHGYDSFFTSQAEYLRDLFENDRRGARRKQKSVVMPSLFLHPNSAEPKFRFVRPTITARNRNNLSGTVESIGIEMDPVITLDEIIQYVQRINVPGLLKLSGGVARMVDS